MLMNLLIGLPVTLLCLLLKAVVVALSLRRYVEFRRSLHDPSPGSTVLILGLVMLLMLFGNFLQMAIWALLYVILGEFESFTQALYFSGVTFATVAGAGKPGHPEALITYLPLDRLVWILVETVRLGIDGLTFADLLEEIRKEHERGAWASERPLFPSRPPPLRQWRARRPPRRCHPPSPSVP